MSQSDIQFKIRVGVFFDQNRLTSARSRSRRFPRSESEQPIACQLRFLTFDPGALSVDEMIKLNADV